MPRVQRFLNPELARKNPTAYAAHFRRLEAAEQEEYLSQLSAEGLEEHVRAMGEKALIGFKLSVVDPVPTLTATVSGQTLPRAEGWPDVVALEARARALATRVGEPIVTCLVEVRGAELHLVGPQMVGAGFLIREVQLSGDGGCEGLAPSLEWLLRGELANGGTMWSQRELLPWAERDAWATYLTRAARACGATFSPRFL